MQHPLPLSGPGQGDPQHIVFPCDATLGNDASQKAMRARPQLSKDLSCDPALWPARPACDSIIKRQYIEKGYFWIALAGYSLRPRDPS